METTKSFLMVPFALEVLLQDKTTANVLHLVNCFQKNEGGYRYNCDKLSELVHAPKEDVDLAIQTLLDNDLIYIKNENYFSVNKDALTKYWGISFTDLSDVTYYKEHKIERSKIITFKDTPTDGRYINMMLTPDEMACITKMREGKL